jgi:hypothetical protein
MPLDLRARPRRLAQELQARRDAGVGVEAADRNALPELVPAEVIGQLGHHSLERDAVQRIA